MFRLALFCIALVGTILCAPGLEDRIAAVHVKYPNQRLRIPLAPRLIRDGMTEDPPGYRYALGDHETGTI